MITYVIELPKDSEAKYPWGSNWDSQRSYLSTADIIAAVTKESNLEEKKELFSSFSLKDLQAVVQAMRKHFPMKIQPISPLHNNVLHKYVSQFDKFPREASLRREIIILATIAPHVTAAIFYIGETLEGKRGKDNWIIRLSSNDKSKSFDWSFSSRTGNRGEMRVSGGEVLKVPELNVLSLLYSVVFCDFVESSYPIWVHDFGCEEDYSTRETYEQCVKSTEKIKKLLSRPIINLLKECFEDF